MCYKTKISWLAQNMAIIPRGYFASLQDDNLKGVMRREGRTASRRASSDYPLFHPARWNEQLCHRLPGKMGMD